MDIEKLKALVRMPPPKDRPEDFDPGDAFGGNYYRCYEIGYLDGERQLAQAIRRLIAESEPSEGA